MKGLSESSGASPGTRVTGVSRAFNRLVFQCGGSRNYCSGNLLLFAARGVLVLSLYSGIFPASARGDSPLHLPEDSFPLLDQILRDSVDSSARMIEEGLRVEEARAEEEVSSSGRYPSVAGTFRYLGRLEERDDFDGTRSYYRPQATLTARQPLYHWGALQANHRIGRLRTAMAEGNRAEAYRMLALAIRADFLDLAVQRKAIDLAERQHELAQQELSAAQTRFEREEIARDELKVFQLAAEEAVLNLERLRRQREFAIREFSRVTGYNPVGREWTPLGIPAFSVEAEEVETPVGPFRPWEEVSRLRVLQAEEQLAVESVRRRPRIDLVVGVAQDQVAVFDRADIDRTVYFAGVELTWNLFDGHETRGRKAAALARRRWENRRHDRQEEEATAEVEQLGEAVEWAGREAELSEEQLELARRKVSQGERDLELGLISDVELGAARVAVAERELAANRSRADYLMAVAEFLSLAGRDPAMASYRSRQR